MRQLRGPVHTAVAPGRHRPLPVQRLRSLPQDERRQPAPHAAAEAPGECGQAQGRRGRRFCSHGRGARGAPGGPGGVAAPGPLSRAPWAGGHAPAVSMGSPKLGPEPPGQGIALPPLRARPCGSKGLWAGRGGGGGGAERPGGLTPGRGLEGKVAAECGLCWRTLNVTGEGPWARCL